MPDIAKIGADGKKVKIETQGIVSLKGGDKGDFNDFSFKEGNSNTLKLSEIFIMEKGKDAFKKLDEAHVAVGTAKVKGGSKGKKKASKGKKGVEKKSADAADVRKNVDKILKYTPSKSAGKKEGTPQKGKVSTKRVTRTPSMPSPGGKKSTRTTD